MRFTTRLLISLLLFFGFTFISSVQLSAQTSNQAAKPAPQSGAVAVVNALYTLHFKQKQQFNLKQYKKDWFDVELYKLLVADEKASEASTDEIVGLDFNPLTNSQEDVGRFRIGKTEETAREAIVPVLFGTDKEATVKIKLVKNGELWQIQNILYPGGDPDNSDLISILKTLANDRKKN